MKSSGGGVLLAVKNSFPSLCLASSNESVEQLLVSTTTNAGTNILLGVTYIPPDAPPASYSAYFTTVEEVASSSTFSHLLLMGDLNQPGINWNKLSDSTTRPVQFIADLVSTFNLCQTNDIRNSRGVILDVVLSSVPETLVSRDPEPLILEDSHHPALNVTLPATIASRATKSVTYNFRKCNLDNVYQELRIMDLSVSSSSSVDDSFNHFSNAVQTCVLRNTPKIKLDSSFPQWFSPELRQLVRMKKLLHIQYKKTLSDDAYRLFSQARAQCKRLSWDCFNNYIEHIQSIFPSNPNKFWSFIKGLKNNNANPSVLKNSDTTATGDQEKCEMFAEFFSSIFTCHHQSPTPSQRDSCNSISSCHFTIDDVKCALRGLDENKGCGPDLIPPNVLKHCYSLLMCPIQTLFNKSIQSGIFPDVLKLSYIVPIHKSGSISEVGNYRPIAIQSALSKVFEKLVLSKIFPLLQRSISPFQHGFSPGKSSTSNLVLFQSDVISSFSRREQVDAVYIDFSKAFDRVSHSHLISKLSSYGIHGPLLNWFSTYVIERRLAVKFASCTSRQFVATSGVPQGSHLGPILFNLFVNDISDVIEVKHLLFADDIKLYSPVTSHDDFTKLQNSLSTVEKWCIDNCMTLNYSKCAVITFHKTLHPEYYDYRLNGNSLKRVTEVKDLGVISTASLSSERHVYYVCSRANRNLGLIMRHSKYITSPLALKTLYCHLVRSHLEYCSVVWSPNQTYLQDRLQSIQSRFVRLVGLRLGFRYSDVPVDVLAAEMGLTPLVLRRRISDLMLLYRLINYEIDCPELLAQIKFHVPAATRSKQLFTRSHRSTSYEQHSAMVRIQTFGNGLPVEIDIFNCSGRQFKRMISSLPVS